MLELGGIKFDLRKLDRGCWWEVRMEGGTLVGDPVDKPANDAPAVLIVPIGTSYERELERQREPFVEDLRRKDISDAEHERIMTEVVGRTVAKKVLRGWQNITFHGEALQWSEEKATEILTDRAWRSLLDFCCNVAVRREAALEREEAEAAGN